MCVYRSKEAFRAPAEVALATSESIFVYARTTVRPCEAVYVRDSCCITAKRSIDGFRRRYLIRDAHSKLPAFCAQCTTSGNLNWTCASESRLDDRRVLADATEQREAARLIPLRVHQPPALSLAVVRRPAAVIVTLTSKALYFKLAILAGPSRLKGPVSGDPPADTQCQCPDLSLQWTPTPTLLRLTTYMYTTREHSPKGVQVNFRAAPAACWAGELHWLVQLQALVTVKGDANQPPLGHQGRAQKTEPGTRQAVGSEVHLSG